MPNVTNDGGLHGESVKETWLNDAEIAEHKRQHEQMVKNWPKGVPKPPEPDYADWVPWRSLGQALTKKQLERHNYEVS